MARTRQSARRSHLPMQFQQTHTHSPPTVRIPAGDAAFPAWWRGKAVAVDVINIVPRCNGYFVRAHRDRNRLTFVPGDFIEDVRQAQGPALLTGKARPHARYRLPADREDNLGFDRSHEWVRARVIQKIDNYVLCELPHFDLDDWWSGYEVINIKSARYCAEGK